MSVVVGEIISITLALASIDPDPCVSITPRNDSASGKTEVGAKTMFALINSAEPRLTPPPNT